VLQAFTRSVSLIVIPFSLLFIFSSCRVSLALSSLLLDMVHSDSTGAAPGTDDPMAVIPIYLKAWRDNGYRR
jgi:hypothetical protein